MERDCLAAHANWILEGVAIAQAKEILGDEEARHEEDGPEESEER
jgi:hypothetical protein